MEEEFSMDNVLDTEEFENLFLDSADDNPQEPDPKEDQGKERPKKEDQTTEVDPEELFGKSPESVGSEDDESQKGKEGTPPAEEGTSPNTKHFYSSIAKALAEEGIFPDLDEDSISKITSPEAFKEVVEKQIREGLDEKQKRVDEALNVGIEPSVVQQYENTIGYLDSITDEAVEAEGEKGETLRRNLIYQDYINRGFSKERANKEVKKAFDNGTDIEDAKDALQGNKDYFKGEYQSLLDEAKAKEEEAKQYRAKEAEELKKSILSDSKVFGDLEIDKTTRQKVFDNISKPIYKDPRTGKYYTAIQKYQMENSKDFIKNLGILYTLTDGFKNVDKLITNKVKKETKRGLKNLEAVLSSSSNSFGGDLQFAGGNHDDDQSYFGKGKRLDL